MDRWTSLRAQSVWAGGTREEMEAMLRQQPPEGPSPSLSVMTEAVEQVLTRAARIKLRWE